MDVMSQFMDVITTFKCKVCEFVCTKQTELFDHVKTEHLPSTSAKSSGTSLDTKPPELAVGEGAEAQTAAILAGLVDETGNTGSYIAGSNIQPVNIQKFVNGNPTEQVVYLDSGENQSQVFLNKNSALDSKGAFICGSCHSSFEDVEKCKKHMVEAHKLEIGVISDSPAAIVLDLDFSSQTENTGDPAATQLSVGKDADTIISGREERPDGKVSMSTQVVRKKVGRKSKAELEELAKKDSRQPLVSMELASGQAPPTASDVTDNEVDTEIVYTEKTNTNVTYVEIEIPGKRKRRAPRHLRNDYLIPRRTKDMTDSQFYGRRRSSSPLQRSLDYPFKCDQCRARFVKEDHLLYHNMTHSKEVDENGHPFFICPETECKEGAQFKTLVWVEFKQHAWKEHSIDLGMLACDQCDYRATVKSKLLIHQQTHGSEKPFVCEICQKGFKQQAQLKNHSLVHVAGVDVKEKESMSGRHWFVQVACGICKRTFANQKSLQCHIEAVHEKLKPFTCKFCGHKAARKAMMQLHMRTHTGEKPFKCDQCDYVTGDHNSMRRHRMRHSGDKPYKCPHCAYACIQAVSLKLHLKSKHPASDRCFSCPKCPYRTVNKTLFGNHLRDHEIGLIDESLLVPSTEYAQGHAEGAGNFSIKLGAIHDLTNGSANVTQLICSALNAIAPSLSEDGEMLPENIETTIETILVVHGGLKSHKVSFQIPATATKNARTAEVVVQEQVSTPMQEMDTLQAAAMESQIPTETIEMPGGDSNSTPSLVINSEHQIQQDANMQGSTANMELSAAANTCPG